MINRKSYTIIWDRIALDYFKEILDYLSKQSSQAPNIVRDGVLSRLDAVKTNPKVFEVDKLKDSPNDEFRAFVIYNYRITYQIKVETKEIWVLRIRHVSQEPFGY
jgi:mRNA-degrading endonuclease RelE of RelBE toxin-antitoxin system